MCFKKEPKYKKNITEDFNPEYLLKIYEVTAVSRNDYRNRIWETMKMSAALEAGVLVVLGGFGFFSGGESINALF